MLHIHTRTHARTHACMDTHTRTHSCGQALWHSYRTVYTSTTLSASTEPDIVHTETVRADVGHDTGFGTLTSSCRLAMELLSNTRAFLASFSRLHAVHRETPEGVSSTYSQRTVTHQTKKNLCTVGEPLAEVANGCTKIYGGMLTKQYGALLVCGRVSDDWGDIFPAGNFVLSQLELCIIHYPIWKFALSRLTILQTLLPLWEFYIVPTTTIKYTKFPVWTVLNS